MRESSPEAFPYLCPALSNRYVVMDLIICFDQFCIKNGYLLQRICEEIVSELSQGRPLRDGTVYVMPKDKCPQCSRVSDSTYAIFLHCPQDQTGLQYAYQFAHEFCHWLIGGDLSGRMVGLFWLEETVCAVASLYCLSRLRERWSVLDPTYPPCLVDKYLERVLSAGRPAAPLPLTGYIESHRGELYTPLYHRDLYSQMALALLPFFLRNPSLWTLLPHFGCLKDYDRPSDWLYAVRTSAPSELLPLCATLEVLVLGDPLPLHH